MVLTRSSYSRLGTPLASPLPNPERKLPSPLDSTASLKQPGPARTHSRSRLTALRRQSTSTETGLSLSPGPSTATSPTRSAPLSVRSPPSPSRSLDGPHSLPPATPLFFQFGFDLINRLDNTLMDQSPASTNADVPLPSSNEPSSQGAQQRLTAPQQASPNDASSATGCSPALSRRSPRVVALQSPQADPLRSPSPSHSIEPQLRPGTLNLAHSNHSMVQSTTLNELSAQASPPSCDLLGCPQPQPAAQPLGLDFQVENTPEGRLLASSSAPDANVLAERVVTVDSLPIASGPCANEARVSDSQTLAGEAHTQPCHESEVRDMLEEVLREDKPGGDVARADASKQVGELAAEGASGDPPQEKNDILPNMDSQVVVESDTPKEEGSADKMEANEAGIVIWNERSEQDKTDDKELLIENSEAEEVEMGDKALEVEMGDKALEVEMGDEAEKEKPDEKDELVEESKAEQVQIFSEHAGKKESQDVGETEEQEAEFVEMAKSQLVEVVAEDTTEEDNEPGELARETKVNKVGALSDNEGEEGESAEYRTAEEVEVVSEDEDEKGEEDELMENSQVQEVELELELEDESDKHELANPSNPEEVERGLDDKSEKEVEKDEVAQKATTADAQVKLGDESINEVEEDQLVEKAKVEGIETMLEDGCKEAEAPIENRKRQNVEVLGDEGEGEDENADEEFLPKEMLQEVQNGSEDDDEGEAMQLEIGKEAVEISSSDESEEVAVAVVKNKATEDATEAADEASDSIETDEDLASKQPEHLEMGSESSSSEEAATDTDSDKDSSSSSDDNDDELDGLLAKARARMRDPSLLADVIPLESASPARQVKGDVDAGAREGMLSKPLVGSQLSAANVGGKRNSGTVIQDKFGGGTAPRSKTRKMDWHELPRQEVTPEVKREIQAMRLHRTLDPKCFVKGGLEKSLKEPIPDRFLFGHVISAVEPSSSSSKPKKRSFVESLVGDEKSKNWTKKKYVEEVQASGSSGGKEFWKALKKKRQH